MTIKIVHYINQFFGQKGGEEAANLPMELVDGPVGPGTALQAALSGKVEIVKTIICGDSYFNENEGVACMGIREILEDIKPDMIVAGPAFNAGRYGMACGKVGEVAHGMGIPAITVCTTRTPATNCTGTSPTWCRPPTALPACVMPSLR